MISFIVKGNAEQALLACEYRKIPAKFRSERGGTDRISDCTLEAADHYIEDIMRWFCEDGNAPFPIGACLHYSMQSGEVRK